ncbi:hypothetical protein BH23CHL1_BH23CHL1_07260 [soil metagenome]
MTNANVTQTHPGNRPYARQSVSYRDRARAGFTYLTGEWPLVALLMVIGLIAHGLNMFNYPAITISDDEGIYAAQAWAVLRNQEIAPYTYFYDHAPGGWILIAGWNWVTGGPHAFGTAIESGRVLMLLMHVAMVPLLYHLSRKLGAGAPAASIAAVLFSISPLAVFYQRMLLLDSIMIFWLLLSLDLILDGWGRLSRVVLSGVCFGLALLAKESAIFLLPALLYIVIHERRRHQGGFAIGGWVLPVLVVVSWYPFYALLKGELLPGTDANLQFITDPSGNNVSGVSLLGTLLWQVGRDGGGIFNLNNQFWTLLRNDWLQRDALLLLGGFSASVVNLFRGFSDRRAFAAGLLGILPFVYLGRGGVVLSHYVLMAIPFMCLNIAVLFSGIQKLVPARVAGALAVGLLGVMGAVYLQFGTIQPLYEEEPSNAGREAIAWIKENVPPESRMIIRDDLWTDLHEPGLGGPRFPNAHSHWKVASDPAIRDGVFNDDWQTVEYLVTNGPQLAETFTATNNTIATEALDNAKLVRRWQVDSTDESLHQNQLIELWKVSQPGETEAVLLQESAEYITERFSQDGAYFNADGSVFSESQAYAMLRSVWMDDREEFDATWQWSRENLLGPDGLMAWRWDDGQITDPNPAADADIDAALALLLAGRQWEDPELVNAGTDMVKAIWEQEVVEVNGEPHLAAGPWTTENQIVALNPSYFSPYAYHIFQEVDPDHNWLWLIETSYQTLFAVGEMPLGMETSAGLPPDWIGLDRSNGALVPLELEGRDTTRYGYDAARTYWRVALHQRWMDDGRANAYLDQAGFLADEANRKGWVSAVYAHDGTVIESDPSVVGSAGAIAALLTIDPPAAHELFATEFGTNADRSNDQAHWDNPDDLYTQEWAWFSIAFYSQALPNLWHGQ